MQLHALLAAGALALGVGLGAASAAQIYTSQTQQTGDQPAAPSQKPARQATTAARTSPNAPVDPSKVGNEQAAPSQAPASEATSAARKQKP